MRDAKSSSKSVAAKPLTKKRRQLTFETRQQVRMCSIDPVINSRFDLLLVSKNPGKGLVQEDALRIVFLANALESIQLRPSVLAKVRDNARNMLPEFRPMHSISCTKSKAGQLTWLVEVCNFRN